MATYKSIRYSTPLVNASSQVLLKTVTVSDGDGTLTISGLNSDYKEYIIPEEFLLYDDRFQNFL